MSKLKKSVVSSTMWLTCFQVIDQLVGFSRILILTHFLSPTEFGYVGFAWLALQIISTFTQPGIQTALIQKKSGVEGYLDASWTFLVLRGLFLFIVTLFAAPYVANFFNDPIVVPILRVLSINLLLESLVNIGMVSLQKRLEFKKQFIFMVTGTFVDFIVTLSLAFVFHSVWAIIAGSVISNACRLFLSYILSNFRPKLDFNFKRVRELSQFSKWIYISSILSFIYSQGDDILVGRILGVSSLGLYQTAYKISNLPTTQITYVFSTVLFPAMTQIQSDRIRITSVYLKSLQLTAFLSAMVGFAIITFASSFTRIFLGDEWNSMVQAMQILTIWGMIRSVGATSGALWQAIGKPRITSLTQIIQVIVLCMLIYPLTIKWGISGASIAVVLSSIIPNIVLWVNVSRELSRSLLTIFGEILLPFIAGSTSSILLFLIFKTIPQVGFYAFIFLSSLFILTYFVVTYLLDKIFGRKLYVNILSVVEEMLGGRTLVTIIAKLKSSKSN